MKSIIQFHISKGEKLYVAEGVDVAIVTHGETLDELAQNIQEAVQLHFADENVEALGFNRSPSVLLKFELPQLSYA